MSKSLTRRQFASLAVAGASSLLLAAAADADPTPTPTAPLVSEGDLLALAVPVNVGHALTDAQAKGVATILKTYPGDFAHARALPIPDDVAPAFTPVVPPMRKQKGRGE